MDSYSKRLKIKQKSLKDLLKIRKVLMCYNPKDINFKNERYKIKRNRTIYLLIYKLFNY